MTKKAAAPDTKQIELSRLHHLLAKTFLNRLENDVACEHCESGQLSGAELTAIRQFLSDNGVTGNNVYPDAASIATDLPFTDPAEEYPTR